MKSIRIKFLTVVISGMLLVAIAVGAISAIYITKTMNSDSDIITDSVAEAGAVAINDMLQSAVVSARTMESYILSSINSKDDILDAEFRDIIISDMKANLEKIAVNSPGVVGYYLRFAPELTTPTSGFFIGSNGQDSPFYEYEPYDLSNWENEPVNISGWYAQPVKNGGATWIAPYFNESNKVNIISYVIPFYIDRTLLGVVGVDLDLTSLTDRVASISVHDYGFAYLAYGDEVVFTPATEHTMNKLDTDHGHAEVKRDLVNGMSLIVHVDYSDIQQDSYRLLIVMVLIALFIVLIFILITYAITIRIVQPLKHLTEAAEHLADGGYEFVVEEDVDSEIGALNNALKRTSDKINSYMTYINNLAYRDALTGVKNSTAYNETVVDIERRMRLGDINQFGVLVCDINMLKDTNDHYGHDVGNQLIIKATKIICTVFKHSPVFRIGGDEFVVLLEGGDLDNRNALVAVLDDACSKVYVEANGDKVPVSIARGASVYNPGADTKYEDIFTRADHNMYVHKEEIKSKR